MKKKKRLKFQLGLLAINVIVVMFISVFISLTTNRILERYDADVFVDGVFAIPWRPADKIWQCAFLLAVLIVTFIIREFVFPENRN